MYFGDVLNSGGGVCASVNCFDGGPNSLQVCKELFVCPLAGVLEVTGLVAPPLASFTGCVSPMVTVSPTSLSVISQAFANRLSTTKEIS